MDTRKIMALSIVFIFIFSITVFALGVTSPVPKGMTLLRGESSAFEFEIQAITSTDDMKCSYSMADMAPLVISFASDETVVRAGTIQKVYGTVTVPSDASFKTYSSELVVSCGAAITSDSGSEVRTTIGGSILSIDVVEIRETAKKTATVPPQIPIAELMLLIIIIIIILGAYYIYKNKFAKKTRPRERKK